MTLPLHVWRAAGIAWSGGGPGEGSARWFSGVMSFGISTAVLLMSGISSSSCGSACGAIVSCTKDELVTVVVSPIRGHVIGS